MKQEKPVISVAPENITKGIEKYKGVIDLHMQAVIKATGFNYTPYTFEDGRILLVLGGNKAAFLYKTEEIMNDMLSLEK